MRPSFTWNVGKAAANRKKHGVSFEEAQTVFDNPLAVIFDDETHSDIEPREIIIGHSVDNSVVIGILCRARRQDSDCQRPQSHRAGAQQL